MATTKPDYTYKWASDGDKIAPSGVKIQTGWSPEIPPYQWENWIQNRQDEMLAHINERGIAEWDNKTDYIAGKSYVQGSDGFVYKSVAASGPTSVVSNPTTDTAQTYWVKAFIENGALTLVSSSRSLTQANIGTVLVNASSALTVTLPPSSGVKDSEFFLQRRDITSNRVIIAASGTDSIMLDTVVNTSGQANTELLFAGDFLRLRSDGAGKWWCVGQAQLPGSIASGLVAFTAPGIHTFTVPSVLRSGRRVPTITVVGAGGAGGESGVSSGRGAGGGAGGSAIKRLSLSGVASVAITVGAGTISNGETSSFGAYCSATGGRLGGLYEGNSASGGFGGTASGGDINILGGDGSDGPVIGGVAAGGSGDGGASSQGGGGRSAESNGLNGRAPGSGGGGSKNNYRSKGADGLVVIEW